MKERKNSIFLNLLCKKDEEEIKDFLNTKGKEPKSICPIRFIIGEEDNKEDNK